VNVYTILKFLKDLQNINKWNFYLHNRYEGFNLIPYFI